MNIKEETKSFLVTSFGIAMICFGGVASILKGWLFWYPLGLLTIPWIDALIDIGFPFGLCKGYSTFDKLMIATISIVTIFIFAMAILR